MTRLNAGIVRALNLPEVRESMKQQGFIPAPGTPEPFAALLETDRQRYTGIAKAAN